MRKSLLILLAIFISVSVNGAGNVSSGKKLALSCGACHGNNGNSATGAWPKLAAQHETYLLKALQEYQKGDKGGRPDPTMMGMAKNLSQQDMEDLAAYFASQTRSEGTALSTSVPRGQAIYRGGNLATGTPACAACHGPSGRGNASAKFPAVFGQHTDYTVKALKAYKAGTRQDDPNGIMREATKNMSDDDISAVASYIEGLH